jgi:phospholipid/cholesterol/gamma-HCH transport system substrate-binding protein
MKKEIKIAILAIVTLALAIWGYKFLSGQNLLSGDQTFYGIYDNVQDVNTATKVQINGVVVGSVISITPQPDNVRKIKLGFTVQKDISLPPSAIADLRSSSPLGGKMIELIFDKMCNDNNCAASGDILTSRTTGLLGSMLAPNDIDPHVDKLSGIIDSTFSNIGNPDSDAALDVGIYEMSESMKNLSSITSRINKLMLRSAKDMEVTMANMAIITESLVQSQSKLDNILRNVGTVTEELSGVKIGQTMEKTNMTIDQAKASLIGVEETMAQATITMTELKSIVEKMDNGDGTLGRMLNDESLYNNLSETTREMDLLLQDIRLNPRRYFRVFGKKSSEYELPEDDPASKN